MAVGKSLKAEWLPEQRSQAQELTHVLPHSIARTPKSGLGLGLHIGPGPPIQIGPGPPNGLNMQMRFRYASVALPLCCRYAGKTQPAVNGLNGDFNEWRVILPLRFRRASVLLPLS